MYLELKNVTFAYDKKKVLNDISFYVNRGEVTGLIGSNGVGKTTTISHVIRKLRPQSGQILLGGKNIYEIKDRNYPVSYIPDEPIFYEELTVFEHLNFVKALYPQTEIDVTQLIEKLELQEHLYKVPGLLSKGTLQKLMIAIAFLRDYELLLADEPLNGLDPKQIHVFKNVLKELCKRNKAILISTHLLDMAEELCDRYVILNEGQVIAFGTKKEIITQYNFPMTTSLEELYLSMVCGGNGNECL